MKRIALVLWLVGCGGQGLSETPADGGAPAPVCVVPAGTVLIEHGCNVDGCEQCGAETTGGYDHVDLGGCLSPNQPAMRCVVSCSECS